MSKSEQDRAGLEEPRSDQDRATAWLDSSISKLGNYMLISRESARDDLVRLMRVVRAYERAACAKIAKDGLGEHAVVEQILARGGKPRPKPAAAEPPGKDMAEKLVQVMTRPFAALPPHDPSQTRKEAK